MSGIFGAMLLSGDYVNALDKKRIVVLMDKLALGAQICGKDATGLAVVGKDKIRTIKSGIDARAFIDTKEYKNFLGSINLSTTYSLIGHCRDAKKGSSKDNVNNSPLVCGNIVGVHNGTLHNDDALFSSYKAAFDRKAKVDSEIVFSMLNHWQTGLNRDWKDSLRRVSQLVKGTSVFVCASAASPSLVCLSRKAGNPLSVHLFEESGVVLFGSSEYYMEKAAKKASMTNVKKISINIGKALLICAETNKFTEIALD